MAQSTSIQRVQRLIDSVPLTNLLFTLLSTAYKKVSNSVPCKWNTPAFIYLFFCLKSTTPVMFVLITIDRNEDLTLTTGALGTVVEFHQ